MVEIPETIDMVSQSSAEGGRLAEMETRLANLLLRYTDNYPEVIRLKSEIENLKQQLSKTAPQDQENGRTRLTSLNPLYQELQSQVFEIDAELSSLAARKLNFQRTIAKREKELQDVPATRKELGLLVQERDSVRNIYNDLLGRMSQSEVSKQMEIGNKTATFRIVDAAVLPKVPVSPNMLKMFLLAIAGGIGCAVAVVYLLESLDNRVRDVSVFEELSLDVLAVIPTIKEPQQVKRQRRKDFYLATFCSFYCCCFAAVFAYEIFINKG